MRKLYLLTLLLLCTSLANSQQLEPCANYISDSECYRYTAEGRQQIIRGDHSKAINESRRIARITAESELATMVNSAITRLVENMTLNEYQQIECVIDTARVSSLQYFNNMKTVCESEPKLIGNTYVTYVTKEISINDVGHLLLKSLPESERKNDESDKEELFIELLHDNNSK